MIPHAFAPFVVSAYWMLVFLGFVFTLISGITGKMPLWVPLLLIIIALMIVASPHM